jgi:Secretion system C-terminal sorting domain
MKKILLGILACGCLTKSVAQVNFQLELMPDRKTYMVSMVSTESYSYPQNITGTAQVTVRMPTNTRFTAGRITSLQPDVKWLDNARIERPAADPTHDYVSFSLTTMATKNIPYVRGVETPLFTFVNIQNDCVGKVELVDNNSTVVKNITAAGFNIKNHISVLAKKGEAFSGIRNSVADCSATTTNTEDKSGVNVQNVYPMPATDLLTIEWMDDNAATATKTVLIVTNTLGQEVHSQKIGPLSWNIPTSSGIKGNLNKLELNVSTWANGLYAFHFVTDKGVSAGQKILVTK